MKLSDRLFEEGVFAQGIAFPTVARDKARVRTIVTAAHTRDELQFALDKFKLVGAELGLISRVTGLRRPRPIVSRRIHA
jgi:glycine C-acetyltransferase